MKEKEMLYYMLNKGYLNEKGLIKYIDYLEGKIEEYED